MEGGVGMTIAAAIVGGTLGAIPGIWALAARHRDRKASYLRVHLSVDVLPGNFVTARTTVENPTVKLKNLANALLLIGPGSEDPFDTVQALGYDVNSTIDIAGIKREARRDGPNGRCLVPLPFFFSENIAVADETISYTVPIDTSSMCKGVPYSVRFFVLPKLVAKNDRDLHRTTHDCFILPP